MSNIFMTAGAAQGKSFIDPVFSVSGAANEAINQYGRAAVINASIGTIYDDTEVLATSKVVMDLIGKLPPKDIMNYAPINGIPGFAEAAIDITFGASKPEGYIAAIATPGGTGGIRNIFYNYAEAGSKILIPDWFWGSYSLIASEFGRKVDYYRLFTERNTFNLASLKEKVDDCLQEQDNLVAVFNTPAHNPTGFSMTMADWEKTMDLFREMAKNQDKRITLLVDVAYMDFAGDPAEVRLFFETFKNLPKNLLITVAYSMSKAFLAYGLRCGALIAISSNQRVVEEFMEVNAYSGRANWSNVSRLPQTILVEFVNNHSLMDELHREREGFRLLMVRRAEIFVQEARAIDLKLCPYEAGFFISLPVIDAGRISERLQMENVFAVPLRKGLRVAICSVPTSKMSGLATKIKRAL